MEYGAVVVWWATFAVLGVAGLPIAASLLPRLPDRGASVALPVALVVLFLPVYWVGHATYGPAVVAAGVLVLVLVSAGLVIQLQPALPTRRFAEVLVVFTAAFALLVAVRAADPSIYPAGGEKFLDYGLLNAVLRASQLPPEDMWFAGEPVRYYYGGQLLAAALSVLTATPAKYAYNLALAGFFGALVAGAYGLAGSISAARGGPYRFAGAVGAVFVGFASNLVVPVSVVLWALPGGLGRWLAGAIAGVTDLDAAEIASSEAFFYWTSSRVIRGTINEFPLFAWINGDLHAHMLSTPFMLLAVAVALSYFLAPAGALAERRALVLGVLPPVAGMIAVVNTWSFPSVAGVALLALVFAPAHPATLLPDSVSRRLQHSELEGETARVGSAVFFAAAVAVLGAVWVFPFFLGPASGRPIGVLPERSGLVEFLLVHGGFLAVFAAYFGSRALRDIDQRGDRAALLVAVIVVAGLLAGAAAVAVVLPLLAVAWLLLRDERGGVDVGFETVLFVAGAGLVLLVEFVFVQEQAGPGRMNTVFKTYMQVWLFWAVGAAAALAALVTRARGEARDSTAARDTPRTEPRRRWVATALAILLVASVSLYGGLAVAERFAGSSELTLDATLAASSTHPNEWEAIQFLDRQPGRPHIVTAPGCWCNPVESTHPYQWVNAPSSFTGVPTVAGWSHEIGYRDRETYMKRVENVRRIYTEPGVRAALLAEYEVQYVYVGPNERALYGEVTFDGPAYGPVFENGVVTIYEVDRSRL